jgi:hypothetical protein
MDNGTIYNDLMTALRKEKEGLTITPLQFSELLEWGSWEKGNADFKKYEQTQVLTDSLKALVYEDTVTFVAGSEDIADLSQTYWHALNGYDDTTRADILTQKEWSETISSTALAPQTWCPVLNVFNGVLRIFPTSITSYTLSYLKVPDTPFFDYYIDANDNIQYLTVGQAYTLQANEVYRDGTTSGTVNSISAELSYPEQDRVDVLYKILQKLGVSLNEQDALQYGMAGSVKEETL